LLLFCYPKKQKPLFHWDLRAFGVHLTDQLSNFRIIPDYLKVVDFIEEMDDLC
jgi:hypothetical protein